MGPPFPPPPQAVTTGGPLLGGGCFSPAASTGAGRTPGIRHSLDVPIGPRGSPGRRRGTAGFRHPCEPPGPAGPHHCCYPHRVVPEATRPSPDVGGPRGRSPSAAGLLQAWRQRWEEDRRRLLLTAGSCATGPHCHQLLPKRGGSWGGRTPALLWEPLQKWSKTHLHRLLPRSHPTRASPPLVPHQVVPPRPISISCSSDNIPPGSPLHQLLPRSGPTKTLLHRLLPRSGPTKTHLHRLLPRSGPTKTHLHWLLPRHHPTGMEAWRQCAHWLVAARVLPAGHRASSPGGQVWDLAQALRDGVLLCHLLNALLPRAVPPHDICPRPQMSQFLCLRNIRTFLTACADKFGLPKHRLFGAFDLFDVQDFGKVIDTLSTLSWTPIAQSKGFTPFPTEDCVGDDDIYSGLSDLIDDTAEEDDDLYDCVEAEGDDGDDIYEDLMRVEAPPAMKVEVDRRVCCLQELRQTEERYTETLESICQHFLRPLRHFLQPQDLESIFINIEELLQLHRLFLGELRGALGGSGGARGLPPLFLAYKERFLLYGRYCSQVEAAARRLDQLATNTDLRMKLQECSQRANNGRFSLRDLLMVPMQRVLKYHLLLQELVKLTPEPAERERLRVALDAMRDLAQCVNEVKRDNETLKQLTSVQLCLHNMPQSLAQFGRPKIDGEMKVSSTERRSKVDRYGFLLDKALIICKRRGDSYEAKDVVDLQSHQLRDGGLGPRDGKKWTHTFLLIDTAGLQGYELFFKTHELKKKWLEQFEMALSNIFPEHALADGHDFQMFSFEDTTSCKACQMLLRGTFYQGYRCSRCRAPAHKECLGRLGTCGRGGADAGSGMRKNKSQRPGPEKKRADLGLPKMEASQPYSGVPPPPGALGPALRLSPGDVVEVTIAEAEQLWWQGRNVANGDLGWFPCAAVRPFICVPLPDLSVYSWYAGPMERGEAEQLLMPRSDGAFLVRQRVKDAGEFAISIKYRGEVKHIKVMTAEGLYRVTEKKAFKGLVELVEFYQRSSLKDCFKALDTTLVVPFKEPESRAGPRPPGAMRSFGSAKARYDFCARDRTELTLREGDVIRVLSKKGHPGWWKGEIYGRVGWFPANYVEEDYSEYC